MILGKPGEPEMLRQTVKEEDVSFVPTAAEADRTRASQGVRSLSEEKRTVKTQPEGT